MSWLPCILCWFRYIDDLLVIWPGTERDLHRFLDRLNSNCYNLKFTYAWIYPFSIFFSIDPEAYIQSDLYRKLSAGNTLLHASSSHPSSLIRTIPYAQYLRLRRNCTSHLDFKRQANLLRERLLAGGYSCTLLRHSYNRAWTKTRGSLLYNIPSKQSPQTVCLVTRFSTHEPQLRTLIAKNWHFLTKDYTSFKFVRSTPELIFRRAITLGEQLTSHYVPLKDSNSSPRRT